MTVAGAREVAGKTEKGWIQIHFGARSNRDIDEGGVKEGGKRGFQLEQTGKIKIHTETKGSERFGRRSRVQF